MATGSMGETDGAAVLATPAATRPLREWSAAGAFGALLAALVLAVHRSSVVVFSAGLVPWKPVAMGVFLGLVIAGGGLVLFYVREGYRPVGARRRWARMATAAVAVLAAVIGWLAAASAVGGGLADWLASAPTGGESPLGWLAPVAAGTLVGIGLALLLFLWLGRFAALPVDRCFFDVGTAFAVAAVVNLVLIGASGAVAVLTAAGLMAVSAVGLGLTERGADLAGAGVLDAGCGRAEGCPSGGEEPVSLASRLAAFGRDVWRPGVGALITVFVFGFTWDTAMVGVVINNNELLYAEKIVGMVAGALGFVALSVLARAGRDAQRLLFNTVLPLMLVAFVVRPYFLSMDLGPGALAFIGVLRETGFVLFLGAAWIALATASCQTDVSVGFAAGAFLGLAGGAALAGFAALYVLGGVSSYLGAILFTLYLVVIGVVKSSGRGESGALSPTPPAPDLETVIAERCAALADQWALTPRERDIMTYLARGHSYPYIAKELVISENTVRTHVRNVYKKADITSREELLALIHQNDPA